MKSNSPQDTFSSGSVWPAKAAFITLFVCCVPLLFEGAKKDSDSANGDPGDLPRIREFSIETLSRLGREIYRHDQFAWVATDLILKDVGREQLASNAAAGWIVDAKEEGTSVVRFLRATADGYEASYDVSFPKVGAPKVKLPLSRKLTPAQLARARAVKTAVDAYVAASLPFCGGQFNTVVLADPDGKGFLVYLLRPMPGRDLIPIGGHFRISVSEDGLAVEQIDQLFASCLTLNPRDGLPKDAEPVGVTMSHVVSSTPLETHVFLSLQSRMPYYVATKDGHIWKIEEGQMIGLNSED